jgi:hypothetical protein
MLTLFWIVLWSAFAILIVAAAVSLHVRRREAVASSIPFVDDDAIRQILRTGELMAGDRTTTELELLYEDDEPPLAREEIDDEEERFWSETWDEPTEW